MIWEFTTIINQQEELRLWRSRLKEKKKLARKKEQKKIAKQGDPKIPEDKTIPIDQVITLDHLTNPDKK